jgi:hypothetical protein
MKTGTVPGNVTLLAHHGGDTEKYLKFSDRSLATDGYGRLYSCPTPQAEKHFRHHSFVSVFQKMAAKDRHSFHRRSNKRRSQTLKRTQFSYGDPSNGEQTDGGRSGNECGECARAGDQSWSGLRLRRHTLPSIASVQEI